jgi:hypothetical protein
MRALREPLSLRFFQVWGRKFASSKIKPQPHLSAAGVLCTEPTIEVSELGWKIAVDFQADADLNEGRGAPRHFHLLIWMPKHTSFEPSVKHPAPRQNGYLVLGDLAAGPFLLPGIP